MKKVLILLAIAASTMSFASSNLNLGDEIRNKAVIDLSEVDLNDEGKDFVTVKFKIEQNAIAIEYIEGSQDVLENRVQKTLESLHIQSDYQEGKFYVMKFNFSEEE